MNIKVSRYRTAIALLFLLGSIPCQTPALTIDVTRLDDDRLQVVLDDIDPIDGRVYTLDRDAGEITFGDGNRGTRPPSGRSGVLGAYRFGDGGSVFNEFDLLGVNFPLPIEVAALLDPKAEDEDINFVLAGVRALKFELTSEEFNVVAAEFAVIPLPTSLALMFSAIVGLGITGYWTKVQK
ncbi:MAG: hypothetical protein OEN02_12960 [Gammaproteobacteria bacterium]|nr:hypothetical protein [Gammaproteobacteria bacterium]MDH3538069.1 hypothetical protein [Gammaproteobacteria bacterium]